jgi:hypothetical protein
MEHLSPANCVVDFILLILAGNHSHHQEGANVKRCVPVLYRLSLRNCKMFIHITVRKYTVLLKLY